MRLLQLQPVVAVWIDNCDHPHNAAITFDPADRECSDGHTFACHFVNVPADILEPGNAVAEQESMARVPFREDLFDRLPGPTFEPSTDIGQKPAAWAMPANRHCEGRITPLLINPYRFHLL